MTVLGVASASCSNLCDWSVSFLFPSNLLGVFLVRTGTVSRDASLLEFRINCARSEFGAASDNPYDGNRKRHCECVPQS